MIHLKALITGASSGMGKDMAYYLVLDLINEKNVFSLYEKTKDENIDILINNAGFGLFGHFIDTDLNRELEMINLNIKAYHILTKLFLQDFVKRDSGYILNVRLSTYYATKNYITKLTLAIYEELRRMNSKVVICALCPGPVATEFNKVAHGDFALKEAKSSEVAKYAIDKMFQKKLIIVPTLRMKLGLFFSRFAPWKLILRIGYNIQYRKTKS